MDIKTEKFLQKLKNNGLYRDDYDYSLVEYKNFKTPITIINENKKEIKVNIQRYLYGKYKGKLPKTEDKTEIFLQELKNKGLFRDDYDYSLVEYKNQFSKIKIIDKNGLIFKITARNILNGVKLCGKNVIDKQTHFIIRCKDLYGDKFKYDKVEYVDMKTPVTIECDLHGEISVVPNQLIIGQGCIKCNEEERNNTRYLKDDIKTENFITKAKSLNSNYDYSLVEFVNSSTPVTIIDEYGFSHKKTPSAFSMIPVLTIHSADDKTAYFKHLIKQANGDKYGLSKVVYVSDRTPVIVFDNETSKEVLMVSAKLLKRKKKKKE